MAMHERCAMVPGPLSHQQNPAAIHQKLIAARIIGPIRILVSRMPPNACCMHVHRIPVLGQIGPPQLPPCPQEIRALGAEVFTAPRAHTHPALPVIRRRSGHLVPPVKLPPPCPLQEIRALGAEVFSAPRGGEVTFHGPGQMVAYPIVDIRAAGLGAHAFVEKLEGAVVSTLGRGGLAPSRRTQASAATGPISFSSSAVAPAAHASHARSPPYHARLGRFGIRAEGQVNGATGVWVGDRKIAAVGVKLSHGVRCEPVWDSEDCHRPVPSYYAYGPPCTPP